MSWDLPTIWFLLIGVLLTGYIVLDGFDLGVGTLYLLVRSDRDRRILLNAIGPVWDGNEVWLVTGGGALFAAFPEVYATSFSGFYEAFMLLLFALIFRAVSLEFRSKHDSARWRKAWDLGFALGSAVAALIFGVAIGNLAWGVPLDAQHELYASFWSLLHPYALLVGLTTVALFALHGACYLALKTEGPLQQQARGWARRAVIVVVVGFLLVTAVTMLELPHMTWRLRSHPWLAVLPLATLVSLANIVRELRRGRDLRAFLSSSVGMAALFAIFGANLYPRLLVSRPTLEHSLTIYNAASSPATLRIMLTIALIGMPFVLGYTAFIYWVFRGKVKLDSSSY